jgi:transposase-like protein
MENNKKTCPHCKGIEIVKRGLRKTQNRSVIQRYFCKQCKKRFVVDDGFFKKKKNENN